MPEQTPTPPEELLVVLSQVTSPAAIERLLLDLLTPSEIEAIGERWAIVKLLRDGQSQRNVRDQLGVSVTTVSRGSRQLKYGHGGFEEALRLLEGVVGGEPPYSEGVVGGEPPYSDESAR